MSTVCLSYVPFGALERPALGLGLLKSALRDAGIDCEVRYGTFPFAERVGLELYGKLAWVRDEMLGEWIFSKAAFPDFHPEPGYLDRALDSFYQSGDATGREFARRYLEYAREQAEEFIAEEARAIVAAGPVVVGVSSTFNQNCAALALTRAIKQMAPEIVTVCGGANCEGEMGLTMARQFDWLDYVVSGDAESSFPELCRRVLDGSAGRGAPMPVGVLSGRTVRSGLTLVPDGPPPRSVATAIDDVPVPDFDDYFRALDAYADRDCVTPGLVVETARGCWWGAIHHCTFCGLNGGAMEFRSKSVARVVAELSELAERYGVRRFLVADNILDQSYYKELLPVLAERGEEQRYDLYLEIKANVTREQLAALHAAGARWLVAGLESLHDDVLRLMDKGTSAWINLQAMKWSRELGIHMSWNMLAGLPGEEDAWFGQMAELVPLITHLEPPNDVRSIRFDRFSPYQADPQKYDLDLRPSWPYPYIYPLSEADLSRLVYFFESATREPVRLNPFRRGRSMVEEMPSMGGPGRNNLQQVVRDWVAAFRSPDPPRLTMTEGATRTVITDTRAVATAAEVVLEGVAHRVHRVCYQARSLKRIAGAVRGDGLGGVESDDIALVLQDLVERRLVVQLDRKFLALAVPGEPPTLPWENEDGFPGGWFVYPRPPRYPLGLEEFMNRSPQEVGA